MSTSTAGDRPRGVDTDTREAEIIGKPQRIAPIAPEEFDEDAKALVVRIRRSLGLGTAAMPEVFGLMLRHAGLFRCQMDMGIHLYVEPRAAVRRNGEPGGIAAGELQCGLRLGHVPEPAPPVSA
jgi:hypothetical protein